MENRIKRFTHTERVSEVRYMGVIPAKKNTHTESMRVKCDIWELYQKDRGHREYESEVRHMGGILEDSRTQRT